MADTLSPSQRSRNMAAIRGKDTKPELIVRKFLWSHGCRYRLNHPRLPGKPDIVLRKYRTCIFVNGCFWHGHNLSIGESKEKKGETCIRGKESRCLEVDVKSSTCCKIPRTRTDFWVAKILRNRERDTEVRRKLNGMGWHCITVWECQLRPKVREQTLRELLGLLSHLYLQDRALQPYTQPEEEPLPMAAEETEEPYGSKDDNPTENHQ